MNKTDIITIIGMVSVIAGVLLHNITRPTALILIGIFITLMGFMLAWRDGK